LNTRALSLPWRSCGRVALVPQILGQGFDIELLQALLDVVDCLESFNLHQQEDRYGAQDEQGHLWDEPLGEPVQPAEQIGDQH
jgi:hypothetical protein